MVIMISRFMNVFQVTHMVIYLYIVVVVKAGLARAGDVISFLLVCIAVCFVYLLYVVADMRSLE